MESTKLADWEESGSQALISEPEQSRAARLISLILMPPLVAVAALVALSSYLIAEPLPAMRVMVVSSLFMAVVPSLYIASLLRRQVIHGGIDLVLAQERLRPYVVSAISCTAGAVILILLAAPAFIWALALTYALAAVLMAIITPHWKISMHAAGTAMPAAALLSVFGSRALPAVLVVPLVCWARVHARMHTVTQVVAGAALGGLIVWLNLTVFLPRL